jgi:anti-sigma B factor antagonist
MEIRSDTVEGFHCIFLKGRLDIAGTQSADLKFTTLTSTRRQPVMVDLSDVDFISSIGIRLLVMNAKSLGSSSAKMVLIKPQQVVMDVLRMAGIDQVIPITASASDAAAMLRSDGK